MVEEGRIALLEERMDEVERRLARTERERALDRPAAKRVAAGPASAPAASAQPAAARPASAPTPAAGAARAGARPAGAPPARPAPSASAPRVSLDVEDLLGGRVLAWLGAIAVLLGISFLVAVGISTGVIGEGERIALATLASLAALGGGVWLHGRRGRTDASLALTATGVAGLFVTDAVAVQAYELLPPLAAAALALVPGAMATALALRWDARGIAALGIVGALLAPVLAGVAGTLETMPVLLAATASAVGVLLWRRWGWLAVAVFAIATPQWGHAALDSAGDATTLALLVAFGALGLAAAVGFELRVPSTRLTAAPAFLLALNAFALAIVGWAAFDGAGSGADAWLLALAVVHAALGAAAVRAQRVNTDVGLLALVLGAGLADVAFGRIADGPLVALGWAAGAAGLAALARRTRAGGNAEAVALAGVGGHAALALLHALMFDAPPSALASGEAVSPAGALALAGVAAGCIASGRLAGAAQVPLRIALDATALALAAYLTALTLDGPALAAAWAAQAAALGAAARRADDRVAALGAAAFLAGALGHGLAFEAPPIALIDGLAAPAGALLALGAAAAAAAWLARLRVGGADWRPLLAGTAALTALHLASALVVTPFQPGIEAPAAMGELGVRQQGQVLLSALWSAVGVAALVVGLRRDLRPLRLGAFALLGVTAGKVFLYDLAALTSVYRVASLVALGLLLLLGAFVWQRLRPRALPDLREAPPALR